MNRNMKIGILTHGIDITSSLFMFAADLISARTQLEERAKQLEQARSLYKQAQRAYGESLNHVTDCENRYKSAYDNLR